MVDTSGSAAMSRMAEAKGAVEVAGLGAHLGLSPSLVFLIDRRANITLAGEPGHAEAAQDAQNTAQVIATAGIPSVVIDTAARPGQDSATLIADGAHVDGTLKMMSQWNVDTLDTQLPELDVAARLWSAPKIPL